MTGGRILDTSALTAAALGDRYMQALLLVAQEQSVPLLVPAGALSDAAASLSRQQQLALEEIVRFPMMRFAPMGEAESLGSGALRASSQAAGETTAGHVVYLAAAHQWPVVTASPDRLRDLYPQISVETLP